MRKKQLSLVQAIKKERRLIGPDLPIEVEVMTSNKKHTIICDVTKPLPLKNKIYSITLPCITIA